MELLENDMRVYKESGVASGAAGAGASGAAPIKMDDPKYAIIVNNKNRFINKELSDLHKKVELKPVKNVLDDEMGKMSYADFKKNYKEIINKVKAE